MESTRFNYILINEIGLEKTKPILIGLSGGPDSLCLLHLARECGLKIVAAHLDHGLREGSAQDAEIVAELCASQQTELISKRIDVRDYSRQHKMTIEEAARSVRYRFLFDTANQIGAQAVLVAHHADDQVETVLMHLLRGTGVAGLRGMQMKLLPNSWSDKIPLVRPLLKTWRSEILDYCREHALEPIQDETNQDTRIHRNRIRQELIPELETYNLKFKQNLLKTIEIIQSEEVSLENQLIEIREELVRQRGKEYVMFNQAGFMSLSSALQRRLLRALIEEVNSSIHDMEFDLVDRAREFVATGNSSNSIQLFNGMEMFRYRHDSIVIGKGNCAGLWPRLTLMSPFLCQCRMRSRLAADIDSTQIAHRLEN